MLIWCALIGSGETFDAFWSTAEVAAAAEDEAAPDPVV